MCASVRLRVSRIRRMGIELDPSVLRIIFASDQQIGQTRLVNISSVNSFVRGPQQWVMKLVICWLSASAEKRKKWMIWSRSRRKLILAYDIRLDLVIKFALCALTYQLNDTNLAGEWDAAKKTLFIPFEAARRDRTEENSEKTVRTRYFRRFMILSRRLIKLRWFSGNTKGKQTFEFQINGKTNAVRWEKIVQNSFASIDCHSVRHAEKVNLSLRWSNGGAGERILLSVGKLTIHLNQ